MTKNTIYYLLFTLFPFLCFVSDYSTSEQKNDAAKATTVLKVRQVCDPDRDRAALVALYEATNGDGWSNKTNWLSNLPIGDWHGITAVSDCVTEIDLNNNELLGTIPTAIGDLSELQYLDLRQNNLSGSIPTEIGDLTNLINLSIYDNELTGEIPATIGNLILLKGLSLNDNFFSGGIPDEIGQLIQLENIFLSNSGISGEIPTTIGNLVNLQGLFMTGNGLTNIPTTIGDLRNLTSLYLSNNAITGGLPTSIGNLTALEILALADNTGLGGTIPESLGNLTQLKRLYLYNNGLTGSIPESLANLSNLEYFYLYTNQLDGCFPEVLRALCNGLSFSLDSDNPGYNLTDNPNLPNDGDFSGFCEGDIPSCEDQPDCSTLQVTLVPTNVSCFGENNGSIIATPSGGMITYSFLWNNNQTSSTITNLSSGTYTVTVTDGNGCTTTQSTTITQPNALSGIITTIAPIKCANGNDGSLGTSFSGGTTPYTYAWNTGSVESTITNLSEGTYELTISDANNCEFTMTTTLSAPSNITGSLTPQMASCFGASDGFITGTFSGGTVPYTYAWNNGATQSNISGLSSDTYTVTVMDFNNCSIIQSAVITAPVALSATIASVQDVSCDGQNGSVELAISGGTAPYFYSLDGTNFQGGTSITNLSAGDYTITVRDNNNCETQVMATVSPCINNTQITCTVLQSATASNTNDGQIQLVITDIGVNSQLAISSNETAITIDLNEGDTTLVLTDLAVGSYTFFVIQQNTTVDCSVELEVQNCRTRDSLALVDLYNSTGGANWTSFWDLSQPMGTWYGVDLNEMGCVICINLGGRNNCQLSFSPGNNLIGTIPKSLGYLSDIENLSLSINQLTGGIPSEIGNLLKLKELDFSNNELNDSIPKEIGNLTELEVLSLAGNELSGELPSSFFNLTNLKKVYLAKNQLEGILPEKIENLINLEILSLTQNQFSGILPIELGKLTLLQQLNLGGNQFNGNIPEQLGNLSMLNDLGLQLNTLNGTIPEQLGNLSNLNRLLLYNNQLNGELPINLTNLTNLQFINISNNLLSGCIPEEYLIFCDINSNFSNNPLLSWEGDFEIFCNGEEQIGASCDDGNPTTTGEVIQVDCSCAETLIDTTTCRYQDSLALVTLYNSTAGANWTNTWDLSQPINTWFGVVLNENGCVNELTLFNNNLNGTIAAEIGNLSELQLLFLSTNRLTGEIPSDLGKLTKLQTLDLGINILSENIPDELSRLTELRALSLASNQLIGAIPSSIGNLVLLEELYLDQNNFSGSIPSSFENLNELQILHMYDCGLTGEIPAGFGEFSNIKRIFLHDNDLSGCFPDNFLKLCQISESPFPDEPGYNFSNNPKLPWQGDFSSFCNEESQVGATCDDGNADTQADAIDENCECIGEVCSSTTINIQNTICFGDTFSFNGTTLSEAGIYRDTSADSQSCDTFIRILELTILNEVPIFNTIFTCEEAEAGIDTVTTMSVLGCDSVVITETLLNPSDSTFLMEFTCDKNQEGTNINVLTNQFGCDSTIFTEVIFEEERIQTRLEQTTCNPMEAGIDTVTTMSALGCDSVVITETLLNPSDSTFLMEFTCDKNQEGTNINVLTNQFGCDSTIFTEVVFEEERIQTRLEMTTCNPMEAGIDTLIVSTLLGCDSMVITNTILLASETTTIFQETCEAAEVGTIMETYTNITGCDSIVILEISLENQATILLEPDNIIINNIEDATSINILENDLLPINADDWIFTIIEQPLSGEVINRGGNQFFVEGLETKNSTIDSFIYEICLTNCSSICDSAKVTLVIDNNCVDQLKKNIPSAFSPQSFETENQTFDPKAEFTECIDSDEENFELIIFNRWGEIVFHPTTYEKWYGTSANGSTLMPRATYYYHLKIRQPAPLKDKIIRGPINLLY